jgi:hypothetical protein
MVAVCEKDDQFFNNRGISAVAWHCYGATSLWIILFWD